MATEGLSFFTHVRGEVPGRSEFLVLCDSFFPGNGKVAYYIPCECGLESKGVTLEENKDSWFKTAGRIIALGITFIGFYQFVSKREWKYLNVVAPLIFLAKVYFRITTQFHACDTQSTYPTTDVNIRETDKPILNQLFGDVDQLPICSHDDVDDSKKLTHQVMKGAYGSNLPFIVIRIRCLSHTNAQAALEFVRFNIGWKQVFRDEVKSPRFFPYQANFTDKNGQKRPEFAENFTQLQQFIADGYYTDDDGCEWQIVR